MNRQRQSGVALLISLVVIAAAMVIATGLLWASHIEVHRTRGLLFSDQAALFAIGAEDWARDVLLTDLKESQIDSLDEIWALTLPPMPVQLGDNANAGNVTGRIEDMQGRLNVNNLVGDNGERQESWYAAMQKLFVTLELDPTLVDILVDWIDPDVEVSFPDGAEDDAYTAREPSYRSANQYITDVSELLALERMDRAVYLTLVPHLAALPPGTPVNVNTASAEVLTSLAPAVTSFDAEAILEARIDEPFERLEDLDGYLDPTAYPLVDFSTQYFRASVIASLGTTRFTMYSLLERDPQTGSVFTRFRSFAAD